MRIPNLPHYFRMFGKFTQKIKMRVSVFKKINIGYVCHIRKIKKKEEVLRYVTQQFIEHNIIYF